MANLVVYYSQNKDILNIVKKYQNIYQSNSYQIETINRVSFLDKLFNNKLNIKSYNLNLNNYQKIILISPLWFNRVPSPVIKFLEENTGKIVNIVYVLYNNNKKDKPKEFDKMDKVLNLRRDKSYFVSINHKDINVRVYQ